MITSFIWYHIIMLLEYVIITLFNHHINIFCSQSITLLNYEIMLLLKDYISILLYYHIIILYYHIIIFIDPFTIMVVDPIKRNITDRELLRTVPSTEFRHTSFPCSQKHKISVFFWGPRPQGPGPMVPLGPMGPSMFLRLFGNL